MEFFYNEQCDKHTKVTHAGVCLLTPKRRFLQLLDTRTSTVQAMKAPPVPGKQGALWGLEMPFASTPNGWQRGQGGLNSDQFRPPNPPPPAFTQTWDFPGQKPQPSTAPMLLTPMDTGCQESPILSSPHPSSSIITRLQKESKQTINLFLQFRNWDIAPKGTPGWAADFCKLKQHRCNLSYAT